jgi:succinyl-diaminopimelate desuccinylase
MSLSPRLRQAILADIDARRGERESFLAKLVQTPSSNPPGDCEPIAKVAAGLLEGLGFTVERHPVPKDQVGEAGMISATNLVVRRRFGNGSVVALNAHGDVVAPGEGWTHPPFAAEVEDGMMYGRGVAVSKSDFATYAFALKALESVADRLKGTVELHFTFDEEAGGLIGPKWLLEKGIVQPDYCISAGLA